jgi:hypothetical protein
MEKEMSILIWKYLDGDCAPEEKEMVQQLLATDAGFEEELNLAKALQQALGALEPEEPSMRFAANVSEKLPALYRPVQVSADLLPKGVVQAFGTLVGAFGLVCLSLFFASKQFMQGQFNFFGRYTLDLGVFSNPLVFSVFVFSMSVLGYFFLDFTLKRLFLRK